MTAFSKKSRDLAMRVICGYYANGSMDWPLDVSELHNHGLPKSIDAEQISAILEAMGYIELTRYYNDPATISLTDEGKCYFERQADTTHEKRVENIRYIITTAIAVAALLKAFLPEIQSALARLGLIS